MAAIRRVWHVPNDKNPPLRQRHRKTKNETFRIHLTDAAFISGNLSVTARAEDQPIIRIGFRQVKILRPFKEVAINV
jgi:hypothetical protein